MNHVGPCIVYVGQCKKAYNVTTKSPSRLLNPNEAVCRVIVSSHEFFVLFRVIQVILNESSGKKTVSYIRQSPAISGNFIEWKVVELRRIFIAFVKWALLLNF